MCIFCIQEIYRLMIGFTSFYVFQVKEKKFFFGKSDQNYQLFEPLVSLCSFFQSHDHWNRCI